MPDVHAGAGCVIGFTADLGDKVIPNIVGVDIGCGMLTTKLGKIDIDYEKLDQVIRDNVPCGYNIHEGRKVRFDKIQEMRCYRDLKDTRRFERSIGTLGGGNHFIEIDEGTDGTKYLVIHTGSRNMGKQVADYYQNLAVELMQGKDSLYSKQEQLIAEYKAQGRRTEIEAAIKELHRTWKPKELDIPKPLCYLTGKYRDDYLHDMRICQEFAKLNRLIIVSLITEKMEWTALDMFETIHNYIEFETNMVRKGAISAKKGEKLLIPINMRDGCIVGVGKGNDDWNQSAPHGAGRIMSRSKAREVVSLDEFKESMDGIYTTSVSTETIDEAPMVYKPMDEIIENIKDTVDILEIIKPVYNFKASEA
jgi:RNA-splicing ligase RtcB